MGMVPLYRIIDEPLRPSRFAVLPIWPVVATSIPPLAMGLLWLGINAVACGSATRRREIALLVGAGIGFYAIFFGGRLAVGAGMVGENAYHYIAMTARGCAVLVALHVMSLQDRSFALYLHLHRKSAPGWVGLLGIVAVHVLYKRMVG